MTHSHEYRVTLTVPLSGSDREQSANKAKIHPLIDDLEEKIKALGLDVLIEDSTVKLGRGKKAAETATQAVTDPLVEAPLHKRHAAE